MAPEPFSRPYFDSSVYIAAIKGSDSEEPSERPPLARALLAEVASGEITVVASTFVVAEVIKDRNHPELSPEEEDKIDGFLTHESIVWVELDLALAREARRMAREFGLRPADAVHLASAKRGGADQLLRWDDRWPGGTFEGVVVCDPHNIGLQGSLFEPLR